MCESKVLYCTKLGFVTYCKKFDIVQFAFGTTAAKITLNEFYSIYEFTKSINIDNVACCVKYIEIPIKDNSISFVLNNREFSQWNEIVKSAIEKINMIKLLESFDKN